MLGRIFPPGDRAVLAFSAEVCGNRDIYATTEGPQGSLWRMARLRGADRVLLSIPSASTIEAAGPFSPHAVAAHSRDTSIGTEPGFQLVDLTQGSSVLGPYNFPSFLADEITGPIAIGGRPR